MLLSITEWNGRLGNNIYQLQNIISVGLYYKYNIKIIKHHYFLDQYILINKDNDDSKVYIDRVGHNFYYPNKVKGFCKNAFNMDKNQINEIIIKLFKYKYYDLEKLDINDVVLHIRSGDLFEKNPHPNYILPPLSYYESILKSNKYNKIYLISEDKNNPCINILLDKYKNIIYNNNSLDIDVQLILKAQNIICSYGTFIPALTNLTKYTKKIYITKHDYIDLLNKNIVLNIIDCNDYVKKMGKWKKNNEQIKLILNYKL